MLTWPVTAIGWVTSIIQRAAASQTRINEFLSTHPKVKNTSNEKLDLEGDHLLYVRAFYEHAIEKWSYDNFDGAKELVFVLANIIEDTILEQALNVLIIVLSKKIELDAFYDKEVDFKSDSHDEKYGYFIVNFNFDKETYINKNKDLLSNEYENLKHLLDS